VGGEDEVASRGPVDLGHGQADGRTPADHAPTSWEI
jgi:hypothetical protein